MLSALALAIAMALTGGPSPRVIVEVFTDRGQSVVEDPRTIADVTRVLAAKGFSLIVERPAVAPFPIDRAESLRLIAPVAAKAGADLIVLGRTSTTGTTFERSLAGTITATIALTKVELRAVRVEDASILWSDAETGTGLARTATSVAARFGDEVLAQWTHAKDVSARSLIVRLSDASGKLRIADLKEFKEVLFVAVDGVEEVVQRALDKQAAELEIQYARDRASFERAVEGIWVNGKRATLGGVDKGAVLVILRAPDR